MGRNSKLGNVEGASGRTALPITAPLRRLPSGCGGADEHCELVSVRLAAVILAPSHLGRIGLKIRASDMMMNADLGAAHAGEEGLGLIGASAVRRAVFNLMIDALYGEVGCELIPMRGFVGVDGRTCCNGLTCEGNAGRLGLGNGRNSAALALASDDHNLALTSLVLSKATVFAIFLAVLRSNMAAKIGAVQLHISLQSAFVASKLFRMRVK